MLTIPDNTGRFRVSNTGDSAGQIVSVRNMNFDRRGIARIARRVMALLTSNEDESNLVVGRPVAFVAYNSEYVIVTNGDVLRLDPTSASAAFENLTPGTGSDYPNTTLGSDGVVFNDEVVVSGNTKLNTYEESGGWNEETLPSLTSGNPHPLCVVENRDELAVGDGNRVKYYDPTYTLQRTLVLPSDYVVTWIRWRQNILYIGSRNTAGRNAKMFLTTGATTAAQSAYDVGSDWTFSGCEYGSSVAILNSLGQLLRFNGGGFTSIDGSDQSVGPHFPVYYSPYQWRQGAGLIGSVCQRGMAADGGRIHILVDAQLDISEYTPSGRFLDDMPSGLYTYDPSVGLYPRAGCSPTRYFQTAPSSISDSTFVYAAGHHAETGDPVFTQNIGSLTGITLGRTYFTVKISETTLKLALTQADALAGNTITIAGTLAAARLAIANAYTASVVDDILPGAVQLLVPQAPFPFYASTALYGASVPDALGVSRDSIMSLGMGRNVGSITTVRVLAGGVTDFQQKAFLKYRDLFMAADKITLKVRTKRLLGLPTASAWGGAGWGEWSDATTIVIDPLLKDFRKVREDDEIEIITGAGAGQVAHVTSIDEAAGAITAVLDRSIKGVVAGDLSDVIGSNWRHVLPAITTDSETSDYGYSEVPVDESSSVIEFKVQIEGYDTALEEFRFISSAKEANA